MKTFLIIICYSLQKDIITKILHTLEHDSEAFPRRSCIECIVLWIRNRKSIVGCFLNKSLEPDSTRSPRSPETSELFARIIRFAVEDFDWEVKIRAIQVIEAVIKNFMDEKPSTSESSQSSLGNSNRFIEDLLTVLHEVKALGHLLKACDDCDHPVSEKALQVAGYLKSCITSPRYSSNLNEKMDKEDSRDTKENPADTCDTFDKQQIEDSSGSPHPIENSSGYSKLKDLSKQTIPSQGQKVKYPIENSSDEQHRFKGISGNPITTIEQLINIIQPIDNLSVDVFLDLIYHLDVQSLIDSCSAADSNIRSNPVCFLEDILACAKDESENLLDCY